MLIMSKKKHKKLDNIKKITILQEIVQNNSLKKRNMIKKISKTDKIIIFTALISLLFSEYMWFTGEKESAFFVGLWVPTFLGFGIYLKLIKNEIK